MSEQQRRSTKHRRESLPTESVLAAGWYLAVPAIALLVGLVLGGLIVGVAENGSGPSSEAATPSATDPSPREDATVVVPPECLEAANTVRDATRLLREGVDALRDVRIQELLDLLNEVEDLDALAREQADTCSQANVQQGS